MPGGLKTSSLLLGEGLFTTVCSHRAFWQGVGGTRPFYLLHAATAIIKMQSCCGCCNAVARPVAAAWVVARLWHDERNARLGRPEAPLMLCCTCRAHPELCSRRVIGTTPKLQETQSQTLTRSVSLL